MRSRFLPIILANAEDELFHLLRAVSARGLFSDRSVRGVCHSFRVRGCASFFLSCKAEPLHRDLQRSGTAYAHFLGVAPEENRITSRSAPFFDAVACGDDATAARIAVASARYFKPQRELAEDFLYVHLLMERFFRSASDAETARILADFLMAIENEPTPRFEICRALLAADPTAFDVALLALIEEHRSWYVNGFLQGRIPEEEWAIDGCFFVEGLALIRLARTAGIPTEVDYPLIPSLALAAQNLPPNLDAWRSP